MHPASLKSSLAPSAERVALLVEWVRRAAGPEPAAWFMQTLAELRSNAGSLARAIGLASRRLGKNDLSLTDEDLARAAALRPGFDPTGLTVDQAARIAFLLASEAADPAGFPRRLLDLHRTAELSESIAFLRGLALFAAGRELLPLAAEGVRSAVRPIFEAVAHRNPYPREMFGEASWNQMVLKALFIGSELAPIQGLDERANADLARVLLDYARERWAAGRPVSPELWRCVRPFARGDILEDLERVLAMGGEEERRVALTVLGAGQAPGASGPDDAGD